MDQLKKLVAEAVNKVKIETKNSNRELKEELAEVKEFLEQNKSIIEKLEKQQEGFIQR